ncbi:hypothetical protein A4A49_14166 [Nicotiana attenuata]|uniref:Uncharacterized protein n=1 Tax=Nicotiana attenuata TaxID=49451 RepID=A0A314L2V3_NICAT|nr:hypothetical protein A4A49_14166 [Nicotiana attenuata]
MLSVLEESEHSDYDKCLQPKTGTQRLNIGCVGSNPEMVFNVEGLVLRSVLGGDGGRSGGLGWKNDDLLVRVSGVRLLEAVVGMKKKMERGVVWGGMEDDDLQEGGVCVLRR